MTKDNPGCYHSLLKYLSELSNIPITEEVILPYNEVFKKNNKGKRICYYSSYQVSFVINGKSVGYLYPEMRKGAIRVLTNGTIDYPYDVDIDHFIVTRNRKISDFGVKLNDLGKSYKDSLGGGWYSKCQLWEINDKFFAEMDCTC